MPRRRGSYYEDDYGDWYEPSRPRPVQDGIRAKTERGQFGKSWWAQRWIGVLETFGWGNRLQRGRTYARQGQVLSIEIKPGKVQAKVQGSRATPYNVAMAITPLSDSQWEQAIDQMAQQAIFSAGLLAGEMPQDIEEAFQAAGIHLLPQSRADINTKCSCPDAANPCKHIAAVYYLLGERFDEDPFLIFQMRGRTREQIMDALHARRAMASGAEEEQPLVTAEPVAPLESRLADFYVAAPELDTISIQVAAPAVDAALFKRLGTAPAGTDAALRQLYQKITTRTLEKLFGEE
ncbi:MAG: SWIM zinc finger family protein [Chloroflexaceae bacterium]